MRSKHARIALLTGSSQSALASGLQRIPVRSTSSALTLAQDALTAPAAFDDEYVTLEIAYDCFRLMDVERHELQWRDDATLGDYLKGLPAECEWLIFVNGVEVDPVKDAGNKLSKLDKIGLVLIPQGGNTMKTILRITLMAVSVALAFIPGMQWWAAAGISIAIGLVNAFLLAPKKPKTGDNEDSKSYGIDGAKNSATEGIPYPVGYGEFRVAGNFSDCYTENVGDDQYLYLRSVLNDGEIDSISDIEINEQPLANYQLVETRFTKGTLTETVNDWFPSSIVQINKGIKLDTTFTTHTTTTQVDRLRLDVTFPGGLTNMNKKDGTYGDRSVTFEIQYKDHASSTWLPMGIGAWSSYPPTTSFTDPVTGAVTYQPTTISNASAVIVSAEAPAVQVVSTPTPILLVNTGTGSQTKLGYLKASQEDLRGYAFDGAPDGSIAGSTDITPTVSATYQSDPLSGGNYQVQTNGQAVITSIYAQTSSSGQVTVTDHRTRAIRKSFSSGTLPRGTYDVRIRRVTPHDDSHDDWIDEVYLTDVAEIENDPVALRGVATLSLKVKLNDQLNAIPQLTCKAKLSLVRIYDAEGNLVERKWSNNPAWVGLDILCGIERGAGVSLSRIDWPRWVEFADYCTANNLTFNGVFDTGTNMGDALLQVLRVGHAAPVPFGTKISVAIDQKRDPVHTFTQGNILKDSFEITYLSMADRANEYEYSYFDKNDRNKQKTIRYVDPKAVKFSEQQRVAQVTLAGVDNYDQARKELWRAVYANRLLIRTVTFDAWLDAINMVIGEVALIQHDMMEWGNSGRLQDGCTVSKLVLDQHVDFNQASNVLVHYDSTKRGSSTIASIVGKKVMIVRPGGQNLTNLQLASKRLISGTKDFEIARIENGTTYHTITLGEAPTGLSAGMTVELWDTDVIEERSVTSVSTNADGTSTLNLSSPLPSSPPQYSNFAFGPVISVKRPYSLVGVSGNGLEKRKLTFVEYNEGVYGPPEIEIPIPVSNISARMVNQVQALMMEYDKVVDPVRNTVNVRIYWNAAHILNYGGADVYMGLNGAPLTSLGSAVNVSELHTTLNVGDGVQFKVVAYNKRGDRAPFASAPMIGGTVDPDFIGLPPPTNFVAQQLGFDTAATIQFSWLPPLDTTAISNYEINYKNEASPTWIGLPLTTISPVQVPNQALGDYDARIRSIGTNGGVSDWVNIKYQVTHPDMSAAPVGLQLNGGPADVPYGEFGGKDAIFTWTDAVRDEVYFLDYQVDIYDEGHTWLRTEYTVTPDYVYSYDKNTVDGAGIPRRAFIFEVRQRGRQGQMSAARSMFCQNPAPVFLSEPVVAGAIDGIQVTCDIPFDTDFGGIKVYASLTTPCTITPENLRYQGLSSSVFVPSIEKGAQHYVIVVPFDAFGDGTPSGEHAVLPITVDDGLDWTPPEQVVGLTLSSHLAFNDNGTTTPVLTATWAPSMADDLNRYEINIRQGAGDWVGYVSDTPNYEWSPVISGELYYVRVRALDDAGNRGSWSDTVSHVVLSDTIPPAAPTNFTGQGAFQTIFLNWLSPPDQDLKSIRVYENTTNSFSTATPIDNVAALPGTPGSYTRGGLVTNTTRYYWISAFDTSGNESAPSDMVEVTTAYVPTVDILGTISSTQIEDGAISTPKLAANAVMADNIASDQILSNHLSAGSVTTNAMVVGSILGDRIKAGTLEGAALSITTSLPASISIGSTGVTIGAVQSQAAYANLAATNFFANNDRNATTPTAPVVLTDGTAVDHAVNTDGSVDISFEWQYTTSTNPGDPNNIDGYLVTVHSGANSASYTFGSDKPNETTYFIPADKLAMILPGVPADRYYAFGVQAYRTVDSDIDPTGMKKSALVKATGAGENPYQPSTQVAFNGNVTGSVAGTATVAGTTASVLVSNAATGAQDPATRINANSTLISPGKIQLTGATTLSSLLYGGDQTLINGGKIAANTITANKVEIGLRGLIIEGLQFEFNKPGTNQIAWTAGTITYTDDTGATVSKAITAGNSAAWSSGTIYIYWVVGATTLSVSTASSTANGANNVVLATYRGGSNLVANYGRTIIDGSQIKTGSVTADRMNVGSLSAITATIGTFQSAPSGQRVTISDSLIQVFDSANVLRVRLGIW